MRILLHDLRRYLPAGAVGLAAAPGLYALSRANYLLFHSIVELVCVVVAFGTFTVAWYGRRTIENGYLLFLGLGMPFIGAIDLVHTLSSVVSSGSSSRSASSHVRQYRFPGCGCRPIRMDVGPGPCGGRPARWRELRERPAHAADRLCG